jgi:hypothetical protein
MHRTAATIRRPLLARVLACLATPPPPPPRHLSKHWRRPAGPAVAVASAESTMVYTV